MNTQMCENPFTIHIPHEISVHAQPPLRPTALDYRVHEAGSCQQETEKATSSCNEIPCQRANHECESCGGKLEIRGMRPPV